MKKTDFNSVFKKVLISLILIFSPTLLFSDNYYWVGGSGNWSDINHWAVTSGGTVLHSQVPTPLDDVFFDANSFLSTNQTVTINLKNAVCRNFDWSNVSNNPELYGKDTTSIRVYGNMDLSTNMYQNFEGDFIFDAISKNKTIFTAGKPFKNNIRFNGIGGGWQLLDDIIVDKDIYFLNGTLHTNNKSVVCNNFISLEANYRELYLTTSLINVSTWQINGNNLILDALSAQLNIDYQMLNIDGSVFRYSDINFTGINGTITNSNVYVVFNNVTFAYDGSLLGDCKINTLTTIGQGNISDNDSINQVIFNKGGTIAGGHHVIGTFIGKDKTFISGNNEIGVALFYANSVIDGFNKVDSAVFYQNGFIKQTNNIRKLLITNYGVIDGANDIKDAKLYGDGYLLGNNNFDTLSFYPGNTYELNFNTTQTVDKQFNINGSCIQPIRILCDTNGSQAIIKCNQNVNGEYLSIRDIKAEGITPFQANNSVDLGHNTNWNIQTSNSRTLYWVNGTGKWSDQSHWDIISGGSGGYCPPTEIDNIIFNSSSFANSNESVTIDIKNAVCNDMTWNNTNGARLIGNESNKIRIYGSLKLDPRMKWMFSGETFFEATDLGNTITSAGNIFNNNEWFVGKHGSWTLTDDMKTLKNIMYQDGEIFTGGNKIDCEKFSSTDTTTRKLHLSTSTITMSKTNELVWAMNGSNLTLFADSSLLISKGPMGDIMSFNGNRLVYNNVQFLGFESRLLNNAYCIYNLVDFYEELGSVHGDCTIDTVTFYKADGTVLDSDTIKTVIFYKKNGLLNGLEHNIEIAYFYDDGQIKGDNNIDTSLFFRNAIIEGNNIIDTCIIFNKSFIIGNNNIRTATLLGDGEFIGEHQFNDLTLSKSNSYYLENNKTQTINNNLTIDGSCTGPIIIQSDKNQIQAIIKKPNGNVEVNYVSLRDIKAEGNNTPFIAYNSVDLGNNSNWDINTSFSKDLYWVGDNGNWSDSLHWSGSSGGIGGYCIPTPIDNVYFDENSFSINNDSVIIDIGNATCHNMYWNGAKFDPTFYSPDTNNLRIFGSLTLNPNMNLNLYGEIYFESTHDGNTINSKNNKFNSNIYFQGINGHWSLSNDFETDSTIYFSNGEIVSNANTVKCWSFNSNFTSYRIINIDGTAIILKGSGTETWYINGINLSLSAINSSITNKEANCVVRTDFGGPFNYNNLYFEGASGRVFNKSTSVGFNNIYFDYSGQIHGNCSIDSVSIKGNGGIFDSDKIEYLFINSNSTIDGTHKIHIAELSGEANIDGFNTIDSIMAYGDCSIIGSNTINQFIQITGKAVISGTNFFNHAKLIDDGSFNGPNEFNILSFSPGNKYELEEGITQVINKQFNIRGNNCFPIILRSQQDGIQASISIPQDVVISGDFIEMRDIDSYGGANFYAGKFSTDISNNSGWVFNNSPGYIFGFPQDTVMCAGQSLIIGTDNFNADENSTFLWQDGSTNPEFNVNNEDSLWVTVNYAFDCSFTDSININRSPSPIVDLGEDRTMCEGDTLDITFKSDTLEYNWIDGSSDSIFRIHESGLIWLTATASNGCASSDTINIIANPAPIVNLGNDTTLHVDETITLDAGNPGSTFIWSTGDSVQRIVVNGAEEFVWVNVIYNGCSGYDSIWLNEYPRCILAVPNAFSPNNDGQNDVLFARGSGFTDFELLIFNRIGELVFQTSDESIGWDGTYKGENQGVDVYMYILKGRCVDGQKLLYKGNITLLR
jgi:gliding motility-associated-like protein